MILAAVSFYLSLGVKKKDNVQSSLSFHNFGSGDHSAATRFT